MLGFGLGPVYFIGFGLIFLGFGLFFWGSILGFGLLV